MKNLFIDIETYSEVDIKKSGSYKYIEDDSFEILLISYAVDNEPVKVIDMVKAKTDMSERIRLNNFKYLYHEAERLHAHNANFERNALDKFLGYKTPINRWHCTMALSASCGLPLSLDKVSEVLELENAKMKSGKALINYFTKPCKPTKANGMRTRNLPEHAPDKWEEFKEYCRMDVEAEREICNRLKAHVPTDTERQCYILDQEINDFGVGIDLELAKAAIEIDSEYKDALKSEGSKLTGLGNPGSNKQLMEWLNENLSLDKPIVSLAKDKVIDLLSEVGDEEIKEILRIKQGISKSSTAKFPAMTAGVCRDGRLHGMLQYYGAFRTGRWAGRFVQLQNLPRNFVKPLDFARELVLERDMEGIDFYFGDQSSVLSQLIRTAFIPLNGRVFAVSDFSSIEARVLAWIADERWKLDVFCTHGKIYEANASKMFKVDIEKVTKDQRFLGKAAELAFGYGGTIGAARTAGGLKEEKVPDEEVKKLVVGWRRENPRIVELWKLIGRAAIKCVNTGLKQEVRMSKNVAIYFSIDKLGLCLHLPSGRKLYYFSPKLEQGAYGDELTYMGFSSEDGGKKTKIWMRLRTWGGKLVENICQAISRDLLMECMLKVNPLYPIVMHIHDELVVEAPEDEAEQALKRICDIMGEEIEWAKGLPLRGEGFTSNYYRKD